MKKIITLTFIALFLIGGAGLANAQGRGHQKQERYHQDRSYRGHDKHRQQSRERDHYRHDSHREVYYSRPRYTEKHYGYREKYYREYVRRYHKHYRDYDRWYYAPKFYNRNEYVYFPGYQTYYDPYRRVYIYRERDRWVPTPIMPHLMVGVNLGNVQVQFMGKLPF